MTNTEHDAPEVPADAIEYSVSFWEEGETWERDYGNDEAAALAEVARFNEDPQRGAVLLWR